MSATSRDLSESQMSDAKVTNHVRSQYRSTVHYPRSRPEGNLHNTSLRAALEWDSQPPRKVPQSVPLSSTAKELHSQFRSGKRNPAEVVRERIASDTLDMETARLCVTGHVERAMRYPRRIREAMCRSDRIGGTVLYWLWEKDERWIPVFAILKFYEFQHELCYLLAAEDLDDHVIQLISTDLPQDIVHQLS